MKSLLLVYKNSYHNINYNRKSEEYDYDKC